MMSKNTICLWYEGTALEAAQFYAKTFPDSAVTAAHRAPGDSPAGKQGDVLMVDFTVMGIPCLGLNGGPAFRHNGADRAAAKRAFEAMMEMTKIDIAAIEAARRG
ncbi:VOC family protein [Caldimonas sp. KR1-144]|uniref:VOC family protein n=1 Tax=Caldimonas sp. KR1-144 TaxID=3400911 RepID=UPI003C064C10